MSSKPSEPPRVAPPGSRPESTPKLTQGLVLLFAFCCGAIVGNLYYAQPLIELIAPDIGLSTDTAGLVVSLTQIGYAVGLMFVVPLGDLLENRKLMVTTLAVAIVSLAGTSLSHSAFTLLAFAALTGFSSVAVQMMVPIAAQMAGDANRGRVVGTVMSGLLFGVLLSRPFASLVADHFGWRAVFASAAVLMAVIALMLRLLMPRRQPQRGTTYPALLASMIGLVRTHAVLRERSFYQACMFGAVAMFWTAAPVELARRYGYSQSHIALFGLVGAAGALVAPVTGRLADAGFGRMLAAIGLIAATLSFVPSLLVPGLGVIGLVITAVVLDAGMQMMMVAGQREIYSLDANSRSRITSVFMTTMFLGGAAGAGVSSFVYERGGWPWIGAACISLTTITLLSFAYHQRAYLAGRRTAA